LTKIRILTGDITQLDVDAIVNAANEHLDGGNGVDGAIHAVAGPQLLEECLGLGGCPTGEARLTKGYNLKAKHIIHTVGPVWYDGTEDEPQLLENCYRNSLQLACNKNIRTIAFPAISTGAYGFPPDLAASIAIKTTRDFLTSNHYPALVFIVCYDDDSYKYYDSFISV